MTNVVSLKLVSIELPIMWYNISSKNKTNQFTIKTYNITGLADTTHYIELPSGNYMSDTFASALTQYMLHKGGGLQHLICTVDHITTKTIIRARHKSDEGISLYNVLENNYSPDFYFEIDFSIEGVSHTLGKFLGFTEDTYIVQRSNTFNHIIDSGNIYEGYLQSEASYGNGRSNYVYISIDDYMHNCVTTSVLASSGTEQASTLGENILGRVSVHEGFSSMMINNTSTDGLFKEREYMGPVTLNRFNIKLLDRYGSVIDLNNNDVSLALEVTLLYN